MQKIFILAMTMMVSKMEAMQDNSPRSRPGLSRFSVYGVSCLTGYINSFQWLRYLKALDRYQIRIEYFVRLRNLLLEPNRC